MHFDALVIFTRCKNYNILKYAEYSKCNMSYTQSAVRARQMELSEWLDNNQSALFRDVANTQLYVSIIVSMNRFLFRLNAITF